MASFIQTISFTTSRIDEMNKLMEDWDDEGSDVPGFRSSKVCKDRDNENAYTVFVEFDSYELAMQNSERPETDASAKRMAELCDGPPTFGNYDVIRED